jgi:CRISPR/Cas system CSM-associated protein Csm3 (group 7 of RAMP superfamily)
MHVGSEGKGDLSDSLFRRSGQGRLLLPGTSVAGALRGHLTRIAPALGVVCSDLSGQGSMDQPCGCAICHLMGDLHPVGDSRASRLIVEDAVLPVAVTKFRDRVGIDRVDGTAGRASGVKFDLETVPKDTQFAVTLRLEDASEADIQLLALALDEWQAGRVRFGGRSSSGLGKLELASTQVEAHPITASLDALLAYARRQSGVDCTVDFTAKHPHHHFRGSYTPVEGSVACWLRVDFTLACDGLFLINDPTEAHRLGFDSLSYPFIPGSSMRGMLRGRAETIARTIINNEVNDEREFLDRCPAANPLSARHEEPDKVLLESGVSRLRWSSLDRRMKDKPPLELFDLADRLFGNTFWGSRLVIEEAYQSNTPVWKPMDFLAIDRFTGGGSEGFKFDALALWKPEFTGGLYLEAPQAWEIGWLLQVLTDLTDGYLTIGHKGFGRLQVTGINFTLGWSHEDVWQELLPGVSEPLLVLGGRVQPGFFDTATFQGWADLPPDWISEWVGSWLAELRGYQVAQGGPEMAHRDGTDPYWNGQPSLYRRYRLVEKDGKVSYEPL